MSCNTFHIHFEPCQELVFMSALVLIASCLCANNFWPWFCLEKELRELKGPQSPLALKISIILNNRIQCLKWLPLGLNKIDSNFSIY